MDQHIIAIPSVWVSTVLVHCSLKYVISKQAIYKACCKFLFEYIVLFSQIQKY
jgi:hypothetical protein